MNVVPSTPHSMSLWHCSSVKKDTITLFWVLCSFHEAYDEHIKTRFFYLLIYVPTRKIFARILMRYTYYFWNNSLINLTFFCFFLVGTKKLCWIAPHKSFLCGIRNEYFSSWFIRINLFYSVHIFNSHSRLVIFYRNVISV